MAEQVQATPSGRGETSKSCLSHCREICGKHKNLLLLIIMVAIILGVSLVAYLSAGLVGPGYHLSLGANSNEYYLTWSTQWPKRRLLKACSDEGSWRVVSHEQQVSAESSPLNNSDSSHKFNYKVKLDVAGYSKCFYDVGWERKVPFQQLPNDDSWHVTVRPQVSSESNLTMAFYSNLDTETGATTLAQLRTEVDRDMYDIVFHNGNFGFNKLNSAPSGNKFLSMIEPIASRVPYQTSAGSSEAQDNFTEYNRLFTMINSGPVDNGARNNFYYSFNAGPVHFIVISTEHYYHSKVDTNAIQQQYEWLQQDLVQTYHSSVRPWVVVLGHRPMYCTGKPNVSDCSTEKNVLRKGLGPTGEYALEELFSKFSVDVQIYSHEEHYERFSPIYNRKVYNEGSGNHYHNARAPVHILTGSAGGIGPLQPLLDPPAKGSQKRVYEYGYCRLMASKAGLHFQRLSDKGKVLDELFMSKN